jgi:NitT/TauT family transport system ATP-binding protein
VSDLTSEIISARQISKTFVTARGTVKALEDISFSVGRGEFVTLVGPSGCGKSTLLQILAGLIPPSSGRVMLNDTRVKGPNPDQVCVVFQDPWLLPWKTAVQNVEFPLQLRGVKAAQRYQRAMEQLELVGLAQAANRLPHELSGGMRQRVSIARALVQNPKVMLMDEPFGALDEQTRTRMGHELLSIWERTRQTIVFITHGLTEAIYLADRIFVMAAQPGRIIEHLQVPLSRPRIIDMIGDKSFGILRNKIWHLIGEGQH